MASKKTNAGYEFLVTSLKADKNAVYADLKSKAEKKGMTIYPVMYGRAKASLGLVKTAKRGQGKASKKGAKVAQTSPQSRGRPLESGSKSGQVRALLQSGMSAAEIAKKVGCTVALVYNVKSSSKSSGTATKRGPGRPKKEASVGSMDSLSSIVDAVRASSRDTERMRRALEQIRTIIASV